LDTKTVVDRERDALRMHREALRGGALPPTEHPTRGTLVHGMALPLTIGAAVMRDRDLRGPFLKLAAVRALLVALVAALAFASGKGRAHDDDEDDKPRAAAVVKDDRVEEPVNVDVPGVHVHLDGKPDDRVTILGRDIPVQTTGGTPPAPPKPPEPPPTRLGRATAALARGWKRIVAVVALLATVEAVAVFFTRSWDDWLSFHASRLAGIAPEAPEPPRRRITFSVRWLFKKLKRKIRGYIVFASGIPVLALLQLVPGVGSWAFTAAVTLWAWYWAGVFTASKSAHAWVDDKQAAPPAMVRSYNARFAHGWWWWPMRFYGRIWAWALRSVNAPAAAFERSPASYLGLALTRTVLQLPGLYLLSRPIIPVASGRLCAESDPAQRFWAAAPPVS
jgi:hypothetical protein